MEAINGLRPGLTGTSGITVAYEDTAAHVGSGKNRVLATPVMVNLMESASLIAIERFLPSGYQSVGTKLDISHIAATPIGMRATAEAELIKVEGKALTFRLTVRDEMGLIGEGTHERIIVNVERFDKRVQEKQAKVKAHEQRLSIQETEQSVQEQDMHD